MSDSAQSESESSSVSALGTLDPPRNFQISLAERVQAIGVGVPAYAARKRQIEDALPRYVRDLREEKASLCRRGLEGDALRRALTVWAEKLDVPAHNRRVRAHNQYYPIEMNLPIDPKTGGYLLRGAPFEPEPELDLAVLLDQVLNAV